MEVFALRWAGRIVVGELKRIMNLAGVFLADHEPERELIDSITTAFLSKIVELKLEIPIIPVLNKLDLWKDNSIAKAWQDLFQGDIKECYSLIKGNYGVLSDLLFELSEALASFSSPIRVIPISASKAIGFDMLFDALSEIWCACGDLT